MTESTRRKITEMTTDLAKLARNIELAGREAPRHRLDATVTAARLYQEAFDRFRYFLYLHTNVSLLDTELSA